MEPKRYHRGFFQQLCFFAVLLSLVSCIAPHSQVLEKKNGRWQLTGLTAIEKSGDLAISKGILPEFNDKPIAEETKIFLIAAGNDSANFIQEILDQKKIWIDKGYSESEIACYYSLPTRMAYYHDKKQYDQLASELGSFRRADISEVLYDIRTSLERGMDNLFVYISSHGFNPKFDSEQISDFNNPNSKEAYYYQNHFYLHKHHLFFGQFGDTSGNLKMKLHMIEEGIDPSKLLLNESHLSHLFSEFPDVNKILVLQSCYSGGFIRSKEQFTNLSRLPYMRILTASRYDRASFGCGTGDLTTYYGEAFNFALMQTRSKKLDEIDWFHLHKDTAIHVEKKEKELGILHQDRSVPQYHSQEHGEL